MLFWNLAVTEPQHRRRPKLRAVRRAIGRCWMRLQAAPSPALPNTSVRKRCVTRGNPCAPSSVTRTLTWRVCNVTRRVCSVTRRARNVTRTVCALTLHACSVGRLTFTLALRACTFVRLTGTLALRAGTLALRAGTLALRAGTLVLRACTLVPQARTLVVQAFPLVRPTCTLILRACTLVRQPCRVALQACTSTLQARKTSLQARNAGRHPCNEAFAPLGATLRACNATVQTLRTSVRTPRTAVQGCRLAVRGSAASGDLLRPNVLEIDCVLTSNPASRARLRGELAASTRPPARTARSSTTSQCADSPLQSSLTGAPYIAATSRSRRAAAPERVVVTAASPIALFQPTNTRSTAAHCTLVPHGGRASMFVGGALPPAASPYPLRRRATPTPSAPSGCLRCTPRGERPRARRP